MPAAAARRLLVFTKPAREGRVKTRLIGDLTPRQAADLHAAFLEDLLARLRGGDFDLRLAWALDPQEPIPPDPLRGPAPAPLAAVRQRGVDLGERLFHALADAALEAPAVAAVGSDHPALSLDLVQRAFAAVESGVSVVLGPADDGGYYLIALAAGAVVPALFAGIPWSTDRVLGETLSRCAALGLACELLPGASDVDTPRDLDRLAARMAADDLGCPRTRGLLVRWHRLPPLPAATVPQAGAVPTADAISPAPPVAQEAAFPPGLAAAVSPADSVPQAAALPAPDRVEIGATGGPKR